MKMHEELVYGAIAAVVVWLAVVVIIFCTSCGSSATNIPDMSADQSIDIQQPDAIQPVYPDLNIQDLSAQESSGYT